MVKMPTFATASGITVYKEGDKYIKIGGRIQAQYSRENPDVGQTTDTTKFRRLRPYIEGSSHADWKARFQWDMGGATGGNEIAVKDAYVSYLGFENLQITFGNRNSYFSREKLTSSKKQQLIERTFVGDHNYGVPDKNLGLHVESDLNDKEITYGVSLASSSVDPDETKLDFDTPVNSDDDFNEGRIIAGHINYHPFGYLPFSQGDFDGKKLMTVGIGAYLWSNDGDNNTHTANGIDDATGKPDIDKARGLELSGGLRMNGFSADAQYNRIYAETLATNYTGGLYKSGETLITNYAVEGGYMIKPKKVEVVVGRQVMDADNYATEWTRTSFGVNYYHVGHDIKAQYTVRLGEDIDGIKGNDENEVFLQLQYVL